MECREDASVPKASGSCELALGLPHSNKLHSSLDASHQQLSYFVPKIILESYQSNPSSLAPTA